MAVVPIINTNLQNNKNKEETTLFNVHSSIEEFWTNNKEFWGWADNKEVNILKPLIET